MELLFGRLSGSGRVYLDANATTPPLQIVLDAVQNTAKNHWGNPGGAYREGVDAKARLDWARQVFASHMNVPPDTVLFTSCGTESNNIALRSVMCKAMKLGRNVMITTSVEHPSVKRTAASIGCTHVQIRVDRMGYVDPVHLDQVLRTYGPRVGMVSIILAQNEIGTIQHMQNISSHVRAHCPSAVVHTDATQIMGKVTVDPNVLGVDMITGSAHKFHGPRGVGILYARQGVIDSYVTPMTGGGQEKGCRSGTENVPGIVGAAVALEDSLAAQGRGQWLETRKNRDAMLMTLRRNVEGLIINGDPANGLCNTLSISFPGVHGHMLAEYLDARGIAVGSGSACSKGKPSETLTAIYGVTKAATEVVHNTIRISLTRFITRDECEYAATQIVEGWRSLAMRE